MAEQDHKILLLVNNAPSHIFDPTLLTHVKVEFFAKNMTSHVQPLDQGIIRCFKAHYRRLFCEHTIAREAANLVDLYSINQLEIMKLAEEAWLSVSNKTIANCWRHSGTLSHRNTDGSVNDNEIQLLLYDGIEILSSDPRDTALLEEADEDEGGGLAEATMGLSEALLCLREVGTVAQAAIMDMAELLDVEGEMVREQEWADTEIVEQVCWERSVDEGLVIEDDDDESSVAEVAIVIPDAAAISALTSLSMWFANQTDPEFGKAAAICPRLIRILHLKEIRSKKQTRITDFMQ